MTDAAPGQLTRQQLYDRIRETSKDEFILAEMKRLGFWDASEGMPKLSEELIARKGELGRELQELVKTERKLSDPEKALNEFRKQRMKEAKARREETKQRRAHERRQRALKWFERQQNEITYIGEDVSVGLKNKQPDLARLRQQSLPVIHNSKALASQMGITLNELRFLGYNRKVSRANHYKRFLIAKKTGGQRLISAPMPRLKRAQYWVLENILMKLETDECAHGFVPGRSIVSNAEKHVGRDVVINLDLKDFFPTVDYRRIRGLFVKLGYSEEVAILLALICSEPEIDEVELDGEIWYIAKGKRHMPQGAPTSPAISNLICRKLDKRLKGLAEKFGYIYTRYADDLTFSASGAAAGDAGKLVRVIGEIISDEGFTIHPEKTRFMRGNSHQEVTGITVNEKLSIERRTLKKFRALLFQIEKDGPEGKKWGAGNLFSSIQGYANFVSMVSPEKGLPLKARVAAIIARHGGSDYSRPGEGTGVSGKQFRKLAAQGQAPTHNWKQASAPQQSPQIEKTDQQRAEERKQARQPEKATPEDQSAPAEPAQPADHIITVRTGPELDREERRSIFFIILAAACLILAIYLNFK